MISSCTSFTLSLNQLVVSVKVASNGSKAISSLSEIWVLVDDVPPVLRSTAFLVAFGVLIGKPIEVDQDSLSVLGPVRLRVWCVDPICICGYVDVFPAAGGFRLRVRVEGVPGPASPPPPPPPRPPAMMTRVRMVMGAMMTRCMARILALPSPSGMGCPLKNKI